MTGFVYRTENKTNGKWYIGSAKGNPFTRMDYYGSSKDLKEDIAILGYDNFTREVLHQGSDYYAIEQIMIQNMLMVDGSNSYNKQYKDKVNNGRQCSCCSIVKDNILFSSGEATCRSCKHNQKAPGSDKEFKEADHLDILLTIKERRKNNI